MVRGVLHFWTTSMNERIRELYRQAHSIRYHDSDPMRDGNPPTVYWQGETSAERFALLIVKECIRLCDQVDIVGADDCIDNIKEYFEVEL